MVIMTPRISFKDGRYIINTCDNVNDAIQATFYNSKQVVEFININPHPDYILDMKSGEPGYGAIINAIKYKTSSPLDSTKINEIVNHPSHYGGDTIYEVIKVMEAWLTPEEFIGAMKFNIHKYNARAKLKGSELENYEKAGFYQVHLIDYCKRKNIGLKS